MAGTISCLLLIDAEAHHHVEMIAHQSVDHLAGARRVVGRIAIDQHVHIGVDVGEHSSHHMTLALTALGAHLRTRIARHRNGAVG